MKGTPTAGKAKAIKEKRELAAELGLFCDRCSAADETDDVREFAAKRGAERKGRSARSAARSGGASPHSEQSSPEPQGEVSPRKSTLQRVVPWLRSLNVCPRRRMMR